jgi:poly-gamma-glutamate synthesis protein (capsule biosynthesis protein)
MSEKISICCVGDLILDEPGPAEPYFAGCKDVLSAQDVMIGHVETPHTTKDRTEPSCIDIQAPPSPPQHLECLPKVGFNVVTTAGNHSYDCGPNGILDTIAKLDEIGLAHCGTGRNITEARKPVFIEKKGVKVGVVSINAAGPRLGWATSQKPGTNSVKVETAYTPKFDMPGGPCRTDTYLLPDAQKQLAAEVADLKGKCDIAVVVFHKGNGGDFPRLDDYEQAMSYLCIDAGADIIFGVHHHILKGVEYYKGKPIYHGLGNFVCFTYAMTSGYNDTPEMVAYLKERARQGRGGGHYKVDFYPWSEKSRLTIIAKVIADKSGVVECGFIPAYIEDSGNVVVKNRDNGGQDVLDFMIAQTDGADLGVKLEWSEDGSYVKML